MGSHTSRKYNVQHGRRDISKEKVAENVVFTNVVGLYDGRWLRFDTLDTAKKVMPLDQHHLIFTDYADLQARFPGSTQELWALGRRFGSKNGEELWASLQLQAYDPQSRYQEMIDTQKQTGKRILARVKRYRKKLDYLLVFDSKEDAHVQRYSRLPPQACAILDILDGAAYDRPGRVFGEEEIFTLMETNHEALHTRQNPRRIWQYYKGTLISYGFLRFSKGERK